MNPSRFDEAIGPECFGGDEYAPDEPTPEEQDRAESQLACDERLYAAAREKASRDELVREARELLAAFPCLVSVMVACEAYEYDDDTVSRISSQEKVSVTFAPGASLDGDGIESLVARIDALQLVALERSVAAGLLDRTLTVTRDADVAK